MPLTVKSSWDQNVRSHVYVSDTAVPVTNADVDLTGALYAPEVVSVGGLLVGAASFTAKLYGSMDGTTFIQDGSSVSVTTTATRFDFAKRWNWYKLVGGTGGSSTTASLFMSGSKALSTVAQVGDLGGAWDAVTASHATAGTFGKMVSDAKTAATTTIPGLIGTPVATVSTDLAAVKTVVDALNAAHAKMYTVQPASVGSTAIIGTVPVTIFDMGSVSGTDIYEIHGFIMDLSSQGSNTGITYTIQVEVNGVLKEILQRATSTGTGVFQLLPFMTASGVAPMHTIASRRIKIVATGNNAANDGAAAWTIVYSKATP